MDSDHPTKILVVDDENQILILVKLALEKAKLQVVTLADPTKVVEIAIRERPDLVLSDLMMPKLDGYGVAQALRANSTTAVIPIAFLTAAPPQENLPKAFRSGIVGYFEKPFHPARLAAQLQKLLTDLAQRTNDIQGSLRRTPIDVLLNVMESEKRSGVLAISNKEGLQGRVVFAAGKITEASMGEQSGEPAITAMRALAEGDFALSSLDGVQGDVIDLRDEDLVIEATEDDALEIADLEIVEGPMRERVLVVDDEQDIQHLLVRAFSSQGYEVKSAPDGAQALAIAIQFRPELVVCDIMMPVMDGWQMYHRLRADYRINESRVLFLSCHPDFQKKLRDLGVRADGFLPKGILLSQILARADQILEPRRALAAKLESPLTAPLLGRIEPLGIMHVLRALAARRFFGVVRAENMWHKLAVELTDGRPRRALDQGIVGLVGEDAFATLCATAAADLSIAPGAVLPAGGELAGSMSELLARAETTLTEAEQRVLDTNLVTATSVKIDERTLEFFAGVAPARLAPIILALRAGKLPREIIATVDLPPTEVEEALRDMARRRIILFDDLSSSQI